MNLADGILHERDRLVTLRQIIGEEVWQKQEMFLYRAFHKNLLARAALALGGHMELVEMVKLYQEMQEFKD